MLSCLMITLDSTRSNKIKFDQVIVMYSVLRILVMVLNLRLFKSIILVAVEISLSITVFIWPFYHSLFETFLTFGSSILFPCTMSPWFPQFLLSPGTFLSGFPRAAYSHVFPPSVGLDQTFCNSFRLCFLSHFFYLSFLSQSFLILSHIRIFYSFSENNDTVISAVLT